MSADRYPLEAWVTMRAADHTYDQARQCCSCGFGAWSAEHVAVMAYREAVDDTATLVHIRAPKTIADEQSVLQAVRRAVRRGGPQPPYASV